MAPISKTLALLLLLAGSTWAGDAPLQVLPDDGVPFEFSTTGRLVMAGDIHGNLDALVQILEHSGLVDHDGHWIGGNAIFLSPGDVLDGNKESILVVKYMVQLKKEAMAAGGNAISTYGNHELMVAEGDVLHVTKEEVKYYQGAEVGEHEDQSVHSFFDPESQQGIWLRTLNEVVKVTQTWPGGSKTVIGVHAGFDKTVFNFDFQQYNATARAWVKYWEYKARTKDLLETQRDLHKGDKGIRKQLDKALARLKDDELALVDEDGAAVRMPPIETAWVVGYEPKQRAFNTMAANSPSWARFNKIALDKRGKPVASGDSHMLTQEEMQQLLRRENAAFIQVGHEPNPDDKKAGVEREVRYNPAYPDQTLLNSDTRIGWEADSQVGGTVSYISMDQGNLNFHNDIPKPKTGGRVAKRMAAEALFGTAAPCVRKSIENLLRAKD